MTTPQPDEHSPDDASVEPGRVEDAPSPSASPAMLEPPIPTPQRQPRGIRNIVIALLMLPWLASVVLNSMAASRAVMNYSEQCSAESTMMLEAVNGTGIFPAASRVEAFAIGKKRDGYVKTSGAGSCTPLYYYRETSVTQTEAIAKLRSQGWNAGEPVHGAVTATKTLAGKTWLAVVPQRSNGVIGVVVKPAEPIQP